nr:TPA_asm: coat protein [Arctotis ophiovirus]
MESKIKVSQLHEAFNKFAKDKNNAPTELVDLLKQFGILDENNSYVASNCTAMEKYFVTNPNGDVVMVGKKLSSIASSSGTKPDENPKEEKQRFANTKLSDKKLTKKEEITETIKQQSYTLELTRLKEVLEAFVKTITLEDEAYRQGDIFVRYLGSRDDDITMLIAAGTKILDALIFYSLKHEVANSSLFIEERVEEGISEKEIVSNVREGKRALQAGIVLVYIQGSLPGSKTSEGRKVPNFIVDKLYDGESVTMEKIGKELSNVSTAKFPAKVLLQMNIDLLPVPVASRCKLNVAGNRAIRYAVFASGFEEAEEVEITETTPRVAIAAIMEGNRKLKLSKELKKSLTSLDGCYKNQLVMHPLSDVKPTIKNFTLKLTCAIVFSLSKNGRKAMAEKIIADKNEAFKRDLNFFGTGEGNEREWLVIRNVDADFGGLSAEGLKNIYKVA